MAAEACCPNVSGSVRGWGHCSTYVGLAYAAGFLVLFFIRVIRGLFLFFFWLSATD